MVCSKLGNKMCPLAHFWSSLLQHRRWLLCGRDTGSNSGGNYFAYLSWWHGKTGGVCFCFIHLLELIPPLPPPLLKFCPFPLFSRQKNTLLIFQWCFDLVGACSALLCSSLKGQQCQVVPSVAQNEHTVPCVGCFASAFHTNCFPWQIAQRWKQGLWACSDCRDRPGDPASGVWASRLVQLYSNDYLSAGAELLGSPSPLSGGCWDFACQMS